MAVSGEIGGFASVAFIKVKTGHETAASCGHFPALAVVPFLGNFRRPKRPVIEVHLGDLSVEIPSTISIHPDLQWIGIVMIACVGTRADLLIIVIKGHHLAASHCHKVMLLAI